MNIEEILKPKSPEEIWKEINHLSPNEMLLSCVEGGFLPEVMEALSQGADVNYNRFFSQSIVCDAITNGYLKIARYLIDNGASVSYEELESGLKYPDFLDILLDKINPATLTISELTRLFNVAADNYLYRSARKIKTRLVKELKPIFEF